MKVWLLKQSRWYPRIRLCFSRTDLNQVPYFQNAEVSSKTKRALEFANKKGSSTWLQTTPSKEHEFILNKQEFVS